MDAGRPEGVALRISVNLQVDIMDPSKEQERQAIISSLRILTASPKSRRQLEGKLKEKGFNAGVVERTLSRLEGEGLLNDRVYADQVAWTFVNVKTSGRKRIAYELKKRGVQDSIIEEVLRTVSLDDEKTRAEDLAHHQNERWSRLDPSRRRKKIYDFLLRRGFDYSLSRKVVETLGKEKS